ncbi:uncharacterized protein PG986_009200 [Apiospora aurea]|uniref:Uncharacterized protein n=1 Tax=Apiospora aurea TaxID=335848 RepID=A0ABR1Q7C1_9PEZI
MRHLYPSILQDDSVGGRLMAIGLCPSHHRQDAEYVAAPLVSPKGAARESDLENDGENDGESLYCYGEVVVIHRHLLPAGAVAAAVVAPPVSAAPTAVGVAPSLVVAPAAPPVLAAPVVPTAGGAAVRA